LDGSLKAAEDWQVDSILVRRGASIGAGAIILPGITIGEFAMVGAGAVVTHDVPPQGLVYSNPARLQGYVCRCGQVLAVQVSRQDETSHEGQQQVWRCPACDSHYRF
jgi:serine acetyltransferase